MCALRQMDRSTHQNAAMVEETSAASATLADEARRLKQMIGAFQLRREEVADGMATAGDPRRMSFR